MSLAAMIAKQREAAAAAAKAQQGSGSNESKAETPVAQPAQPAVEATPAPAKPAKFVLGQRRPAQPTSGPESESVRAGDSGGSPPVASADGDAVLDSLDNVGLTLDDIGNTTVEGLDQSERGEFAFADEIPATAPARELPEDLDSGMKAFVAQLNSIYEVVHDPDLLGQMIRTIMQELQENPDYTKLMADQDVHTMIRGLRQSMGLAKVKKAEKSTKARGSKKAPSAPAMLGSLEEMFNTEDF